MSHFTLKTSLIVALLSVAAAARDQPRKANQGKADASFVEQASLTNLKEIRFGNLALTQSRDPAVKQLGQALIEDHAAANEQLEALAGKKDLVLADASMLPQKAYDALKEVEGVKFDLPYLARVIQSHRLAIKVFERESLKGEDAELKAFATRTLPTLRTHLQNAQLIAKDIRGRKAPTM